MKKRKAVWMLALALSAFVPTVLAQDSSPTTQSVR
jgi:hypothetical protein